MDVVLVVLVIASIIAFFRWCWRATWGTKQDWLAKSGRCTKCGYDLRASNDRCPECGQLVPKEDEPGYFPLRDEWPEESIEPRTPGAEEFPVDVHRTANDLEANLLQQQLEARGIRSDIEVRPSPLYRGSDTIYVKVWSRDESAAKRIVLHLLGRKPSEKAN